MKNCRWRCSIALDLYRSGALLFLLLHQWLVQYRTLSLKGLPQSWALYALAWHTLVARRLEQCEILISLFTKCEGYLVL